MGGVGSPYPIPKRSQGAGNEGVGTPIRGEPWTVGRKDGGWLYNFWNETKKLLRSVRTETIGTG